MTKGDSGSKGHGVLVGRDVDLAHQQVGHLAGEADRAQVEQHQVVVGAAGDHGDAALLDPGRPGPGRCGSPAGCRSGRRAAAASPKATALAAITCSSGPPWLPGKTALSKRLPNSASWQRIRPPRGPRRVLWVVVVTTWQWGTGLGCRHRRHQSGDVGHVSQQEGTDVIGDRSGRPRSRSCGDRRRSRR